MLQKLTTLSYRISNGSWRIIKRYRELFKCPYPIYVDEQRHLYEKMGMVRDGLYVHRTADSYLECKLGAVEQRLWAYVQRSCRIQPKERPVPAGARFKGQPTVVFARPSQAC